MREVVTASLASLIGQSPLLLVVLAGMIVAMLFLRRYPPAGILVLIGTGLLFVSSIIYPFAMQYILHSRDNWEWTASQFGIALSVLGVGHGIIVAVSIGLLIVAAFVGRPEGAEPQQGRGR